MNVYIVTLMVMVVEDAVGAPPPHSNSHSNATLYPTSPHSLQLTSEIVTQESVVSPTKNGEMEGSLVDGNTLQGNGMTVKHFYLWTRETPTKAKYELLKPSDINSITDSTFHPRQTHIIIHGFLGWGYEPWILHLKDKLLSMSDINVISVDWPAGTGWFLPTYYLAVERVPKVGGDCARLLSVLGNVTGLSLSQVHFIGHSLGAHVAGLAAKQVHGKIGRITGLDPAGLTFRKVPASQRLDSSDADYVDVMHTNGCYRYLDPWGDCYGINENLGHSDFWPNGGEHQPACYISNGDIGCDHELAYVYYIESLNYGINSTYFLARPCSSWSEYTRGNCSCGEEAQYMGYYINTRLKGRYYVTTNLRSPYARKDTACSPGIAHIHFLLSMVALGLGGVVLVGGTTSVGVMVYQRRRNAAANEDGSGLITEEEGPDTASDDKALVP